MEDLHVMESELEAAGTGVVCQHTTEGTCMVNQWDVATEKEKYWGGLLGIRVVVARRVRRVGSGEHRLPGEGTDLRCCIEHALCRGDHR